MVECKSITGCTGSFKSSVLIDTWWNVNLNEKEMNQAFDGVLIDTWWNVNRITDAVDAYGFCFNRYMVECKLRKAGIRLFFFPVLIDTWWNVN